jgi:hypothetical protein
VARELVARWAPQTTGDRFVLAALLATSLGAAVFLRTWWTDRAWLTLGPALAMGLASLPLACLDHPTRLERNWPVFLIIVLLSGRSLARRIGPAVVLTGALLLALHLDWPDPPDRLLAQRPPPDWVQVTDQPRLGRLWLPPEQADLWPELDRWRRSLDGPILNRSLDRLEVFLWDLGLPATMRPGWTGFRPEGQAALTARLAADPPAGVIFRTSTFLSFWWVTPYVLIFHYLDSFVLAHYALDRTVGPYQLLVRAPSGQPRTYNDLLAPPLRDRLSLGQVPWRLGQDNQAGLDNLRHRLIQGGAPPERLWTYQARLGGSGRAVLAIAPRRPGPAPVEVAFDLAGGGPRTYVLPLGSFCWAGGQEPEEAFSFDLRLEGPATAYGAAVVDLGLGRSELNR